MTAEEKLRSLINNIRSSIVDAEFVPDYWYAKAATILERFLAPPSDEQCIACDYGCYDDTSVSLYDRGLTNEEIMTFLQVGQAQKLKEMMQDV